MTFELQQLLFGIERAHLEVVERQFGMQTQTHRFQIAGAGLGIRTRRFHGVAHSSKHVRFVGHIQRNYQVGSIGLGGRGDQRPVLTKDVRAQPKRPQSPWDSRPPG